MHNTRGSAATGQMCEKARGHLRVKQINETLDGAVSNRMKGWLGHIGFNSKASEGQKA
jgi:hypothetical protein